MDIGTETYDSSDSGLHFKAIEGATARTQFQALLNSSFQVPAGHSFFEDFPVWDEGFQISRHEFARIGVFKGETLLSCAGVRMAELKAPLSPLPVALIGAVATDPSARGQGLASRAVSLALTFARDRGAGLALLWGSEHSLYGRLGFALCGDQMRIGLGSLALPHAQNITRGWNPALFELLAARGEGLLLRAQDRQWYEAHRNVAWYWSGEKSKPSAFAAIGRGIDLQGIVHEWGGEPRALMDVLAEVRKDHPRAEILGHPGQFEALGLKTKGQREKLCLASVLDAGKIGAAFLGETRWKKISPSLEGLDGAELADRLFNPGATPPLPLWIWGLDGA